SRHHHPPRAHQHNPTPPPRRQLLLHDPPRRHHYRRRIQPLKRKHLAQIVVPQNPQPDEKPEAVEKDSQCQPAPADWSLDGIVLLARHRVLEKQLPDHHEQLDQTAEKNPKRLHSFSSAFAFTLISR